MSYSRIKSYLNKEYYTGRMLRYLLEDDSKNGVYCHFCGNISNAIVRIKTTSNKVFNFPVCQKHLIEKVKGRESYDCPCLVVINREAKSEKKIPEKRYIIGVDFSDKVNHACCIISRIENDKLVIVDTLTSKDDNEVKRKVEEYDPNYFSLDSIHKRRFQAISQR